ncbi:MAG: TetR/AcrR family transcriptional regulator [Solobacterium sp.]|nr:TetR/AcrR family transcriptional regulator [Solobacterium sp.]
MKEKQENRRTRMTKQLLKDALLELLEQDDLGNITVTAICETADVHRSTFYKYYTDPGDLLKSIEQDLLDRIPVPPRFVNERNREQLLAATTAYFDDVKKHRKYYQILFSEHAGNTFASKLIEHLCDGYVPVSENSDETSARFIKLYIANGTVGMLREWVNEDFPISSQRIAEMMYSLSNKINK